nr:hypothetical protein CFP56_53273 [Quercus suber]
MRQYTPRNGPPHDWNVPLKYTITTQAAAFSDLHPSGRRGYNMQELAQLAGFPWWRLFAPNTTMTDLRKMIGNAVPCEMIKDQYLQIHKSLDKGDLQMAKWLDMANDVADRRYLPHPLIELDAEDDVEMIETFRTPRRSRRVVVVDLDDDTESERIIIDG